MNDEKWMALAADVARRGIEAGQTPFGAVVVRDQELISEAHNTVWRDTDPSAHAEVNAIRLASRTLETIDLSGTVMYTSCEPCPMCLTAIHWSKIDRVVYGATIADAAEAGFSELHIPADWMAKEGGSHLLVEHGPLRVECRKLFQLWKEMARSGKY